MNQSLPVPTLGPELRVPIFGMFGTPGLYMRLSEDQRKCVLFFGYPDTTPGRGGIHCIGTGFLVEYEGAGYLVTARHLSYNLRSDPFLIRLNKKDGTSQNIAFDGVVWTDHPDATVDVSVVPMHITSASDYDVMYLGGKRLLLSAERAEREYIGPGCLTYTVGLFRLLSGEKRNLPIVHSGSIALMPGDEKIPIRDWTAPEQKRRVFVQGYLVETSSLRGLSGSPVFVRPQLDLDFEQYFKPVDASSVEHMRVAAAREQVRLLGLWQGSWDGAIAESW